MFADWPFTTFCRNNFCGLRFWLATPSLMWPPSRAAKPFVSCCDTCAASSRLSLEDMECVLHGSAVWWYNSLSSDSL